ncbi:DUF4421 family protein [Chitinophaga arvensicola]|uniref:DUF4421 domain-containing protein n=1 Tax=Chitinophaga arvensicola TaxID=29529 RepID=A0A1I0RTD0_9BACT|nr:DUF4421 family protein [Chitinophaga arvensicola]SEW44505.1 protein of unknown function [Chitinophaga arvensicola]
MSVAALFIGLFVAPPLFSPDSVPVRSNAQWVEKMDKQATVRFTESSDVEKLSVLTGTNNIYLSPNVASVSQLSFSYRFVTANINFAPHFIGGNNDDDIKGKTTSHGIGFNLNFDHWQQELSYTRVRGFYLENTKDYMPSWTEGMPYLQFPQLVYTNYRGVTAYSFNRKFSVNAVVSQTERQLKSAGSFIPLLSYRYYITDDRSPVISSTQKSGNLEILLGAGYQYTLVYKQIYLSLGVTPSYGYIFTTLTTRSNTGNNTVAHNNTPAVRLDARLGLGYNGRRFYAGAYTAGFGTASQQKNTTVINENSRAIIKAFVGYRFKAPAFLTKKFDQVDSLSSKFLPHK